REPPQRRPRDRALLGRLRQQHQHRPLPRRNRRDDQLPRPARPRAGRLPPPLRAPRKPAPPRPATFHPDESVEGPTMNNLEFLALMNVRNLPGRREQPTPADWASVLARFPLFTGVGKRRLRALARTATLAEFAPGEPIILAGDQDNSLYVI